MKDRPGTPGSPEDDAWLAALIERSPLLPESGLRHHWQSVLPWLDVDARYALAAILKEADFVDRPSAGEGF